MAKATVLAPSKLDNPLKLSKDLLNAIVKDLDRLTKLDKEVAEKAIRYVVDGTDDEVVLKLTGMSDAGEALYLVFNYQSNINWNEYNGVQESRTKIFFPKTTLPPDIWLRLAEVYVAALQQTGQAQQLPTGWTASLTAAVAILTQCKQNHNYGNSEYKKLTKPIAELLTLAERTGVATEHIVGMILNRDEQSKLQQALGGHYYYYGSDVVLDCFTGWGELFSEQIDLVRAKLANGKTDEVVQALHVLNRVGFNYSPILETMARIGTASGKTMREHALPILEKHKKKVRVHVEKILADGNASERHEAAQLLWRLYDKDAEDTLRKHAEQESATRVKQTIDKLLAAPIDLAAEESIDFDLPAVQIETGEVPLPDSVKQNIREHFERGYQNAYRNYERQLEQWNSVNRPQWMSKPTKPAAVDKKLVDGVIKFMEGTITKVKSAQPLQWYANLAGSLGDWFAPPDVKVIHLVRWEYALQRLHFQKNYGSFYWYEQQCLETYRANCPEPFDLRELDAAVAALPNGSPGIIAEAWMNNNSNWSSFCDWEDEAVWPLFAEHDEILRKYFGPSPNRPGDYSRWDYNWPQKRRNAFRVLGMFPQLPSKYIPLLWDVALGDSKTDRPLAQDALATVPGKVEKVVVALSDGKQTIRAAAAEWLGDIGEPEAIEPLKEKFRKEKQDMVKGAIMTALDELGADVNEFLDRKELLKEAKKGLEKKQPKGLDWFAFDKLPALHWEDTGKQVDPAIVKWWVVQSVQYKNPVPGPILRRFLSLCPREETKALAKYVLASWIGHDTQTISHQEAADKAQKDADQQWQWMTQHQYYMDQYKGKKENLYQYLYNTYRNECLGSANAQKGMLALAACGDRECAKMCEQYIRKWFGNRLAQCKALIEVLAWIDDPQAIQVLLSIANRFRTKALRKAAEEHVEALADREGWTLDELADRTIPDGGFARETDDDGKPIGDEATLVLDYGPRTFTVKLGDDLQPVITRDDGKTVKAPPSPAKNDDADKAKAAKKQFSDAKKVVKEVVKRQGERLYEALCTQRAWTFDDWQRYLAHHPIVGKLCCCVVWAAFGPDTEDDEPGEFLGCFRPLEDGSLTNEDDDEVNFAEDSIVCLAHTCNVSKEVSDKWHQHLEDYDVTPLFAQFGRDIFTLPEKMHKESELKDFEGHCLTTFQLRGKATKLGWLRGEAEDGGCFYLYRKPFPSLGLQAVLEFTGSYVPEEDVPAALTTLYFLAIKGDNESAYSWNPSKMPLKKIPPVLLSEVYNDVQQIATAGSGYDAKWQERSYF